LRGFSAPRRNATEHRPARARPSHKDPGERVFSVPLLTLRKPFNANGGHVVIGARAGDRSEDTPMRSSRAYPPNSK